MTQQIKLGNSQYRLDQVKSLYFLWKTPNRNTNIEVISNCLLKYSIISKLKNKKGISFLNNVIISSNIKLYESFDMIYERDITPRKLSIVLYGTVGIYKYKKKYLQENMKTNDLTPTKKTDINQEYLIAKIKSNRYFGHKLQFQDQQIDFIKAEEMTYILELDMEAMYKLFSGVINFPELNKKYDSFRYIPIFKDLQRKQLIQIVEQSKNINYIKDSIICNQGQQMINLYFIVAGEFGIFKQNNRHRLFPVATLIQNDMIGMQQILMSKRYNYTIKCNSLCGELIQIPIHFVEEILQKSKINMKLYQQRFLLRRNRVQQFLNINKKLDKNVEQKNNKLSYKQKSRFYTQSLINNKQGRVTYLTNKKQRSFQNQQSFYQNKIYSFNKMIDHKYGQIYKNKFIDIFSDFKKTNKRQKSIKNIKSLSCLIQQKTKTDGHPPRSKPPNNIIQLQRRISRRYSYKKNQFT